MDHDYEDGDRQPLQKNANHQYESNGVNQVDGIIDNNNQKQNWYSVLRRKSNIIRNTTTNNDQHQLRKSRSIFSRTRHNLIIPATSMTTAYTNIKSSGSDQVELLSTASVDRNCKPDSIVSQFHVEHHDSTPVTFGNYSGNPMFTTCLKNPQSYAHKLFTYQKLHGPVYEGGSYFSWNVWEYQGDIKKLRDVIHSRNSFSQFIKNFQYEKVTLMREMLVPSYDLFKNGYLVNLKINNKDSKKILAVYANICENCIFDDFPNPNIKINVCGVTFKKDTGNLIDIILWIHPILNMSFGIVDQVALLLKSYHFDIPITKAILADINNGSKAIIKNEKFSVS
ncbi:hypothetical protein SBY92_002991 [Candida maltosa Xu316]